MQPANEICPTTAWNKSKEGALFVDVRRKDEIDSVSFDVPNCLHIPMEELEERFHEIPKDTTIVMVCLSGSRSLRTTYYMMHAGYEKVFNLRDGIIKWAQKGFPTKGDRSRLLSDSNCDCSKPNCC